MIRHRPRRTSLLLTFAASSLLSCTPSLAEGAVAPDALRAQIDPQMPWLVATYKELHRHPELSHHEEKTSALVASELRKSGYAVTERVGTYANGSKAWGVVAILANGPGPTVMLRTDLDALPVTEATGLDYASHDRTQGTGGTEVGVMHACGHDIHMTVLLGVARELADNKSRWHGTVMLVGQPSEETGEGAKAMLADGLYDRFKKPDFILDEHDTNEVAAGHVATRSGPLLASATTVEVVFHGVGGHGSRPAAGKDPIVMGSEFVVLAQAVVSRQIAAQDPTVLTVGTFHAGTKSNIIPDDAFLGLTLRAYSETARQKLIEGVKNAARGVATAYGVAPERMPEVTVSESTAPTINDGPFTERMRKVAQGVLGAANVEEAVPVMGAEDVGAFSLDGKIPLAVFWLGAADPQKLATAKATGTSLPSIHSALFAPVYEPTIRTGVTAFTAMALSLLPR